MAWEESESVDEWLDDYVPGANPPRNMFASYNVELGGNERDMYPGWIEGLNRDLQTVGWAEFQALDTSEHSDPASLARTKRSPCPDLGIYPRNRRENWLDYDPPSEADEGEDVSSTMESGVSWATGEERISDIPMRSRVAWGWAELLIELKHEKGGRTYAPQGPFPKALHRGQLADYANEVFNRQHRLCFFMIAVLNDYARLVMFDRRGAAMTPEFNYIQEPDVVGTFLYRLSRLDYAGRGHDPTVEAASEEDERIFRALPAQCAHHRSTTATGLRDAATKGWRIYRVVIEAPFSTDGSTPVRRNSDLARHELLIGKPASVKGSLVGRGTRGFVAYDLSSQQVVFLKDSWRPDSEDIRSEFDNYMLIRESVTEEELHIPTLLGGGDVKHNGIVQRTRTPTTRYHPFIHFRLIIKEVCRRLEDFKNSLQLLSAVADACGAHMEIWVACKLLHRDVSAGNILIYNPYDDVDPDSDNIVGLLADWDLAKTEDEVARGNATQQTRSGTWPFMSARLQRFPEKRHELADDIESFYHVLNWCALLHLPHADADDAQVLARFMSDMFDFATAEDPERGHPQKLNFMTQGTPFVTFPKLQGQVKHPLDSVLKALAKLFQLHYYHVRYPPVSPALAPNLVGADYTRTPRPVRSWAKKISENTEIEYLPDMRLEGNPVSVAGPRDPARSPLRHHDAVLACFLGALSTTKIHVWPGADRIPERPVVLSGTTTGKRASGGRPLQLADSGTGGKRGRTGVSPVERTYVASERSRTHTSSTRARKRTSKSARSSPTHSDSSTRSGSPVTQSALSYAFDPRFQEQLGSGSAPFGLPLNLPMVDHAALGRPPSPGNIPWRRNAGRHIVDPSITSGDVIWLDDDPPQIDTEFPLRPQYPESYQRSTQDPDLDVSFGGLHGGESQWRP